MFVCSYMILYLHNQNRSVIKTSLHLSLRFVPKHRTLTCFFLTFERQIISLTHCDIVSYPSKASPSWFKLQLGLKNGLFFSPECLDNWRLVEVHFNSLVVFNIISSPRCKCQWSLQKYYKKKEKSIETSVDLAIKFFKRPYNWNCRAHSHRYEPLMNRLFALRQNHLLTEKWSLETIAC